VIDELEAEPDQSAVPVDVTDQQRVWALMALAARAEHEAALATLAAVERLFARAGCQGSGAAETGVCGDVTGCPAPPLASGRRP
jgi:hypothetical protein